MIELLVSKAKDINTSDVDSIIRDFQKDRLWAGLATYWITKGNFEMARDVFEKELQLP
jgi:pre-mRNA-splicing factor SYF1